VSDPEVGTMEAPLAGGQTGPLPIQGQGGRREWRKVNDVSNGRDRLVNDGPPGNNQDRQNQAALARQGNVSQRKRWRNGRMFHPGSSEHSSDSDHHGGDGSVGHSIGGPVSPQEMINQNIGHEDEVALYDEVSENSPYVEHCTTFHDASESSYFLFTSSTSS
jgi:hypothetical protein